ncbi:MAG: glycosyltransferase [candidate division WOR-3 bacterium]|nr:glycosyltransferase [candidate division WOR-3 bacterium]
MNSRVAIPTSGPVRVSYIISTRNRAQYLSKTLDNVREFITPEDELLIMDGASTDNTAEVVRSFSDVVTVFRSEPDLGEAHATNKALLIARGDYIKFLTDDDYFIPDAMRHAIAVLEKHPEIDALICGGRKFRIDPATSEAKPGAVVCAIAPRDDGFGTDRLLDVFDCGLGLFLTRRMIAYIGLLDASFRCVDIEYARRLVRMKVNFQVLNIDLYRYYVHEHSGCRYTGDITRDWIRVNLQTGDWEVAFRFGVGTLADAFGLAQLPHGRSLTRLIWNAERIRRSRFGVVLRALDLLLNTALLLLLSVRKRIIRGRTTRTGATERLQHPNPHWDGKLYPVTSPPVQVTQREAFDHPSASRGARGSHDR